MSGDSFDYDLLVIGSGPAGQRAAIQGAKLDKKVAIVERRTVLGGCSVNLGTIPSKTLREAALELCGYRSREFYGASYTVKQQITMQDLLFRTDRVIQHEIDVTRHQLLPFVDHEIVDEFSHHLRENRVTLRLNESVGRLEIIEDEHGPRVRLHLDSGKTIIAEKALYSVGRTGATGKLNLAEAGLAPDSRGRLAVDEHYQTQVPAIYAVGDMIGFPALASTSMEQGRLAVCHAFGVKAHSVPERFPYGIYAVP